MMPLFPLAPRYRLDDELPWLEGIDPARNYWLRVNGEEAIAIIPGLSATSWDDFKAAIKRFRQLEAGEQMVISRAVASIMIHCISTNCYAVEAEVKGAPVWHLFDHETLDSLLMTAHPDWQCSPHDMELGRRLLARAWEQQRAA